MVSQRKLQGSVLRVGGHRTGRTPCQESDADWRGARVHGRSARRDSTALRPRKGRKAGPAEEAGARSVAREIR